MCQSRLALSLSMKRKVIALTVKAHVMGYCDRIVTNLEQKWQILILPSSPKRRIEPFRIISSPKRILQQKKAEKPAK